MSRIPRYLAELASLVIAGAVLIGAATLVIKGFGMLTG